MARHGWRVSPAKASGFPAQLASSGRRVEQVRCASEGRLRAEPYIGIACEDTGGGGEELVKVGGRARGPLRKKADHPLRHRGRGGAPSALAGTPTSGGTRSCLHRRVSTDRALRVVGTDTRPPSSTRRRAKRRLAGEMSMQPSMWA
eukprot:scaffold2692_cov180-Isochrysis_galbana.AAC.2